MYTTEHCSVCETAMDWLLNQDCVRGMSLRTVDIANDDALLAELAERIPVLQAGAGQIDWPFDETQLLALIAQAPSAPP
ncbi:MAG: glutaredoxin family protein [Pseudomonadales bacterium]